MQERAAATDTCMDAAVAAVVTSRRSFCFGRTTRLPQHWKVSVVVLLCQASAAEQSFTADAECSSTHQQEVPHF